MRLKWLAWVLASGLALAADDPFDYAKHIDLGHGRVGRVDAQWRYRAESWRNFQWNDATDGTFHLWRGRLGYTLDWSPEWQWYFSGESALSTDPFAQAAMHAKDINALSFQQFYGRYHPGDWDWRLGRQYYQWTNGRFISASHWDNTTARFDGLTVSGRLGPVKLSAFGLAPVSIKAYEFDRSHGPLLWGAGFSPAAWKQPVKLYALRWHDSLSLDNRSGVDKRYTLGLCARQKKGGYPYALALMAQGGDFGAQSIRAFGIDASLGRVLDWHHLKLKGMFSYASGGDRTGGIEHAFYSPYPKKQKWGRMDLFGHTNVIQESLGGSMKFKEEALKLGTTYTFWQRAKRSDGVYDIDQGLIAAGNAGASRDLGREWDVFSRYDIHSRLRMQLGYQQFFSGSFFDQAGLARHVKEGYVSFTYTI